MSGNNPKIWTSNAWMNPQFIKSIAYPIKEDLNTHVEHLNAYELGGRCSDSYFPKYIYFSLRGMKKKLPNFFNIKNGLLTLSSGLANLMRDFDLGRTQIHDVELREFDQVTPTGRTYAILNIAEHKDCFVQEKTTGYLQEHPGQVYLTPSTGDGYDGLAVRSSAAEGVDLWMDPRLRTTPFFSDRLAQAMKKGKFGRLGLNPCIVVD